MGCGSCSSGGCSPLGCKNNGNCGSDCGKMTTFDWLNHVEEVKTYPKFDLVEVRFKGGRKDFYRNTEDLDLVIGDAIIVDVQGGHHLGHVSLTGELARLQMNKKKIKDSDEIKKIYRIASKKDLEKYEENKNKEGNTLYRGRELIIQMGLKMKLSDVEFQADGNKATFYYSADDRVDFRELIKILASEFSVRVEMKQISLRQEAGRLGGIGSCGRDLCCSTWLTEFKSVSTSAARYQNLSVNPAKISGQCGRLKCCLNYELDTYMEALKDIPTLKKPLKIKSGSLTLQKTDIFKKLMWFYLEGESEWKALTVETVQEIIILNEKGEIPDEINEVVFETTQKIEDQTVNLENNLKNLDKKFNKSKTKSKPKNNNQPLKSAEESQELPSAAKKTNSAKRKKRFKPKKKDE